MRDLLQGYCRFRGEVLPEMRDHYAKLAEGQSPRYLFITCCDSRVYPHEFTQSDAGDLFIERSIGNLVPSPGSGETEAEAAVEYAVTALGVRHIIVCGHSHCGAMNALLHPESLRDMPAVAAWLTHAEETRAAAREFSGLEGDARLEATIRANVLIQVEHVLRLPCVVPRHARGELDVHGWVYEFEHGKVLAHDPRVGKFVPLLEAFAPLGLEGR